MIKQSLLALSLAAAFSGGWLASSWHTDSLELSASKAATAAAQAVSATNLEQAEAIQSKLSEFRANETTIIRENVKLVDRPVYRNVCLDVDGLRNANAAKNGPAPGGNADGVP